ncbi:hypothetical protein OROGR_007044 [Orobanche gracilis]
MNDLESPQERENVGLRQDLPSSKPAEPSSSSSPGLMQAFSSTNGMAAAALRSVLQRVNQAAQRSVRASDRIRVVAASKTKQVPLLRQVYDAGHRCFGENYVQELVEKAPQTGVPNLSMVETVDDEKIANHLDRAIGNIGRKPLKVMIQVNTSGEESKYGVEPAECVELAKHVSMNCPNLEFCGLMTIGMPDYTSTPENFKTLANCRSEVCKALEISEEQCELSMGMSGDFELAIEMGSTNVRIGSTIFGAREYPKKQSN